MNEMALRMRKLIGVGFLILAASLASAQGVAPQKWNPRAPENTQVLPNFSFGTVEPVLNAIGARHQRGGQPGRPSLVVTFPNNRRAVLTFGSCDAAGACKALAIQSVWPKLAGAAPAAAIQSFNQRFTFAKAFLLADGRPALQRYLTADYGFVRGNLAVNLLVFANQAERFAEAVRSPQPAK